MRTQTGHGRAGTGRAALVLQFLLDALPSVTPAQRPPAVLDCGGGSGTFAVPLAQAGAFVTVIDISADALATLRLRAEEAGVQESVRDISGDVERVGILLDGQQYDLVLAHGILDAVDDIGAAFAGMAAAVRPGGLLSLLVVNPNATVIGRALVGELDDALVELRELGDAQLGNAQLGNAQLGDARPSADPAALERICADHGLVVETRHGVGVFSDLVPGSAADTPAARETLARLDFEAAAREPYRSLAARLHLLARRPVS